MAQRRALVLVNRKSRSGDAGIEPGLAVLREHGIDIVEESPESPEAMGEVIARHRDRIDCIIVAGGDGSLNAAAPYVLEAGLPLGVVPLGTGNDLARTLDIPFDVEAASRIVAEGHTRPIDLGRVNGRYFFNVANIGLGVAVTRRLSGQAKRRWRGLAYLYSAYDAMKAVRPFHVEIICDGQRVTRRVVQVAIGNGCYYGAGMRISETAAIDDGRLDLYALGPQSVARLIALIPALRSGRIHKPDSILSLTGREIEVRTSRRRSITLDGELATQTPAKFDVVPGALTVYAPAPRENDNVDG